MTPQYAIAESTDVDEHASQLGTWEQHYEQISAGSFKGRLEVAQLGPVVLFRETFNQAVTMRGATQPGTATLATIIDERTRGWLGGRLVDANHAVQLAHGCEFEVAVHGAGDLAALSIDVAFLNSYAQRVEGIDFVELPRHHHVFQGDTGTVSSLRDLLMATLAAVGEGSMLLQRETLQRALLHSLCDELITRSRPSSAQAGTADITAATRQRVVKEARQYMSQHADEPISVVDLCEAIHASRRTLQYSFQDVLQMSPVAYLRALRLNGMRRELRRGGGASVGDLCARWGFWHLSRFAADYRHMFGELPSETLCRARATLTSR